MYNWRSGEWSFKNPVRPEILGVARHSDIRPVGAKDR